MLLDGLDKTISELIAAFKRELTRRENEEEVIFIEDDSWDDSDNDLDFVTPGFEIVFAQFIDEDLPVEFKIAEKDNEYYCFSKDILSLTHDLFIHEDIELTRKIFIAERGISVFSKIASESVIISIHFGSNPV